MMHQNWKQRSRALAALGLSLILALSLAACASSKRSESAMTQAAASPDFNESKDKQAPAETGSTMGDDADGLRAVAPADSARKIISDLFASLEVPEVPTVLEALKRDAEKAGGYVASFTMNESSGAYYADLVLRLPAAGLENFAAHLNQYGKVIESSSNSQDITDEYYDIQSRLKNAETQEAKLIEIMKQATTVEDLLLVRQELDNVQERIERFKGKIQLWDKQVQYANFTLRIYTEARYISEDSTIKRPMSGSEFWTNIQTSFSRSLVGLVNFFAWLAIALVRVALPLLILAVLAFLIWLLVRKIMRKHARRHPAPQPHHAPYTQAFPYATPSPTAQPYAAPFAAEDGPVETSSAPAADESEAGPQA